MQFLRADALFLLSYFSHALIIKPMGIEMTTDEQTAIVISNSNNKEIAVDVHFLKKT